MAQPFTLGYFKDLVFNITFEHIIDGLIGDQWTQIQSAADTSSIRDLGCAPFANSGVENLALNCEIIQCA
ncbi:hypothetical protein D3C76_1833400 [compost metagenome]